MRESSQFLITTTCKTPTSKSVFFSESFDPILSRFFGRLTSETAKQLMILKKMIGKTHPPVKLVTEVQTEESELLKTEDCVEKSTDTKHGSKGELNDGQFRGSYIVGGSVFGLNFITYGGSEPVYYGMKKDRGSQMKP